MDYCSALGPFDTKIAGAELLVVVARAQRGDCAAAASGFPTTFAIEATERSFLIRRIDEAYVLVVVLDKGPVTDALGHLVARTAAAFRREAGLRRPLFESTEPQLQVEVRPAVNWPYAPLAFRRGPQAPWETVSGVLGRSVDRPAGLVWFRLRSETGAELTVAHDEEIDRWVTVDDGTYGDATADTRDGLTEGEQGETEAAPSETKEHEPG